ncbi:MAG: TetR family transcriptional regulator [Myxococcales bacterium]|nr:MAG: TetR family transcriptional regulator [Myxococcales bacterium]
MSIGLRERKKLRTREELIRAATRLFLEHGFDHITVDDVAQAAEISRSTFFRYFPSKEDVVFPYQRERISRLAELVRQPEAGELPFKAVRYGCLAIAAYFMEIKEELLLQRRIIFASPFLTSRQTEYDNQWEKVIADRLIPAVADNPADVRAARIAGGAIFGVIRAVLRDWFEDGCRQDLVKLGETAFDLLKKGFDDFPEVDSSQSTAKRQTGQSTKGADEPPRELKQNKTR